MNTINKNDLWSNKEVSQRIEHGQYLRKLLNIKSKENISRHQQHDERIKDLWIRFRVQFSKEVDSTRKIRDRPQVGSWINQTIISE